MRCRRLAAEDTDLVHCDPPPSCVCTQVPWSPENVLKMADSCASESEAASDGEISAPAADALSLRAPLVPCDRGAAAAETHFELEVGVLVPKQTKEADATDVRVEVASDGDDQAKSSCTEAASACEYEFVPISPAAIDLRRLFADAESGADCSRSARSCVLITLSCLVCKNG